MNKPEKKKLKRMAMKARKITQSYRDKDCWGGY